MIVGCTSPQADEPANDGSQPGADPHAGSNMYRGINTQGGEQTFAAVAKWLSGEAHSSESNLNCFKL